jgi:hypothetical protein
VVLKELMRKMPEWWSEIAAGLAGALLVILAVFGLVKLLGLFI